MQQNYQKLQLAVILFLICTPSFAVDKLARCRNDQARLRKIKSPAYKIPTQVISRAIKEGVPQKPLRLAIDGFYFYHRQIKNKKYLSLIDYSMNSRRKRLFIINTKTGEVFRTFASHGKGSDKNHDGCVDVNKDGSKSFSNKPGTHASSEGYMITGGFYKGRHGQSMMFHGLEKNINDRACDRSIVMHQAKYVPWGRSFGCPAVLPKVRDTIFSKIAHGSLVYSFSGGNCQPNRSK